MNKLRLNPTAYRKWKRRLVEERGRFCENCGKSFTPEMEAMLDLDHIISRGAGGKDEDWNAQLLCRFPCHRLKTDGKFIGARYHEKHPRLVEELEKRA